MFSKASVIAFVATTRPERAREFYGARLGLELIEESPYALVFRSGSTMLRVQRVTQLEPQPFTALGWDVPDIRAAIGQLQVRGISTVRYPSIELDSDGIWWTPDGNGVAWFKDPDGNVLSLTQFSQR